MSQVGDQKKAVILFSGGLDSSTVLAIALNQGYTCFALNIDYGQRHRFEIQAAQKLADYYQVSYHLFSADFACIAKSALTNRLEPIPKFSHRSAIPTTYVPARNLFFLSLALAYAESIGADHIFIGANAVDYSGYPDCRPDFFTSFEKTANLATKFGAEGGQIKICLPLLSLSKSKIIQKGSCLNVPYHMTVSCYDLSDQGVACGRCDACFLRKKGFLEAKINDPTRYF